MLLDRSERRHERREARRDRREDRQVERHLRHLQRLGYVSQGPVAPYPAPVPLYGAMGGYPTQYPPQAYPNMAYPGQYPSLPQPNMYFGQAPSDMYAGPPQGTNMGYIPLNSNMAYTAHNGVNVEQHEAEKKWYDLDENKKSALIAGGLVVGLAAIAGGVYYVHSKHKKEGEEMNAQAWDVQNWMITANQRTESLKRDGPKAPTTWIYSPHIDDFEKDLIQGGEEDGQPWYIARASHSGGLIVGKCRPGVGAFIGSDGEAVEVSYYEALTGDLKAVKWVSVKGKFTLSALDGAQPIEGGYEADKTPLAVVRAHAKEHGGVLGIGGGSKEGIYPGRTSTKVDGAYVTVGEKDVKVEEYEVLCYA